MAREFNYWRVKVFRGELGPLIAVTVSSLTLKPNQNKKPKTDFPYRIHINFYIVKLYNFVKYTFLIYVMQFNNRTTYFCILNNRDLN